MEQGKQKGTDKDFPFLCVHPQVKAIDEHHELYVRKLPRSTFYSYFHFIAEWKRIC